MFSIRFSDRAEYKKKTLFTIEGKELGREKLYVKSIIKYLKLMNKYIFGIKNVSLAVIFISSLRAFYWTLTE